MPKFDIAAALDLLKDFDNKNGSSQPEKPQQAKSETANSKGFSTSDVPKRSTRVLVDAAKQNLPTIPSIPALPHAENTRRESPLQTFTEDSSKERRKNFTSDPRNDVRRFREEPGHRNSAASALKSATSTKKLEKVMTENAAINQKVVDGIDALNRLVANQKPNVARLA